MASIILNNASKDLAKVQKMVALAVMYWDLTMCQTFGDTLYHWLLTTLWGVVQELLVSPSYRWGKWGSERWSNLLSIIQQIWDSKSTIVERIYEVLYMTVLDVWWILHDMEMNSSLASKTFLSYSFFSCISFGHWNYKSKVHLTHTPEAHYSLLAAASMGERFLECQH